VSAILNPSGPPTRVLEALEDGRFSLVVSEPLLAEAVSRPRLVRRNNLTAEKRPTSLRLCARVSSPRSQGPCVSAAIPTTTWVIETAINGHADVLVSRDDDLKRSPEVNTTQAEHGIQVLSVQQFLNALHEAEAQPPA